MTDEAKTKYYNSHILYVATGVALPFQVENCFAQLFQEVGEQPSSEINMVEAKQSLVGYAYIWINNPEIFNLIIGKNSNGSDRIDHVDDPHWTPPHESLDEAISLAKEKAANDGKSFSWADETEIEDSYDRPQIQCLLPPVVTLSGYDYTDDQRKHLVELAKKNGEDVEIPTKGYLEVSPAYVTSPDDGHCHSILVARNIPSWVSERELKRRFALYTSDPTTKFKRRVNRKDVTDTYPCVTIVNKSCRLAFVTFDPSTRDAQFALLMTRKVNFVNPINKQKHQVIFGLSYAKREESRP